MAEIQQVVKSGTPPPDKVLAVSHKLAQSFGGRPLKRVLMIVPPDADRTMFNVATARRGRYWNYPPYGFGLLASQLRQFGVECEVVNLNNSVLRAAQECTDPAAFDFDNAWREPLAKAHEGSRPDLVCITCMFSQTHKSLLKVVAEIRRILPDVPIAAGGVHITNSLSTDTTRDQLLKDLAEVDYFFLYEADLALRRFAETLDGSSPLEALSQIIVRLPEGIAHFSQRLVPEGPVLNTIPAYDLLDPADLARWGKIGSFYCHTSPKTKLATVLANRGCRAQCTFCSVRNFNGIGVRRRSLESVIEELKILRYEHGIGHVMWLDDDFLYNAKESLRLFEGMVKANLDMTWDCTNGVIAASCTDELISAAAASGCIGLNIGMESGSRAILRKIKKPGTVENFLAAADVLSRYEQINARVFLMIGFPNETYRQVFETFDVSRRMNLDWYNVTILQPLPNTPIFNQMLADGLLADFDFSEIRYNSGSYGKHKTKQVLPDLLASDFKDAFNVVDLDAVPPREALDDIWAYMNFHLNFCRLLTEHRPEKLVQKLQYVENITDIVAPDNAIALYFLAFLQNATGQNIDEELAPRLEKMLAQSPYWQARFAEFGLAVDHLRTRQFILPPAANLASTDHSAARLLAI